MLHTSFYLASTPLHVFLSSAIALSQPKRRHILLFIDQPVVDNNLYHRALMQWEGTPFLESHIFQGRIKGIFKKVKSRKNVFKKIHELVIRYQPDSIFTGNDRRIEFQYCMSVATPKAKGIYIDEGTFTYIGREASSKISDTIFDNIGKKLTYGFWWKNPPTIGGSSWISDIYVAFPDLVHHLLKHKVIHPLEQHLLENPALKNFADQILRIQEYEASALSSLDTIIVLPHESLMKETSAQSDWKTAINEILRQSKNVGVKYHPRDNHQDLLDLASFNGITIIPRKTNFEALLPHLPSNCSIIGDFSSVLLNARWLRPELTINAIDSGSSSTLEKFKPLYARLNINIIKINQLSSL